MKILMMAKDNLKKVVEKLLKTKGEVSAMLEGTEYTALALRASSQMDALINQFSHIAGIAISAVNTDEFPPITNYMGEDIEPLKTVVKSDYVPTKTDREIFMDKVESMYDIIEMVPSASVVEANRLDEQISVIKGVAVKAGVEGAKEWKTLSVPMIDELKAAIVAKRIKDEEKAEWDRLQISQGNANSSGSMLTIPPAVDPETGQTTTVPEQPETILDPVVPPAPKVDNSEQSTGVPKHSNPKGKGASGTTVADADPDQINL